MQGSRRGAATGAPAACRGGRRNGAAARFSRGGWLARRHSGSDSRAAPWRPLFHPITDMSRLTPVTSQRCAFCLAASRARCQPPSGAAVGRAQAATLTACRAAAGCDMAWGGMRPARPGPPTESRLMGACALSTCNMSSRVVARHILSVRAADMTRPLAMLRRDYACPTPRAACTQTGLCRAVAPAVPGASLMCRRHARLRACANDAGRAWPFTARVERRVCVGASATDGVISTGECAASEGAGPRAAQQGRLCRWTAASAPWLPRRGHPLRPRVTSALSPYYLVAADASPNFQLPASR